MKTLPANSSTAATSLSFSIMYSTTTEIYTLSLHDALPIFRRDRARNRKAQEIRAHDRDKLDREQIDVFEARSEEHTSELQSRPHLVCRLLLEKKKPALRRQRETRTRTQRSDGKLSVA